MREEKMKDPWLKPAPAGYPVREIMSCSVQDRLYDLRKFNVKKLKAVIAWPETQKTVKDAARRRLRKLEKASVVVHEDGSETVEIPGLPSIPVLGVVNCTGQPLPEARKTGERILAWKKQ
ncbi:MAG: hypothetical protein JXL84_15060 [Deltaproteobacteria bacterium]|nr:hypothetical protein [Deltaproteobacteria bacterium]